MHVYRILDTATQARELALAHCATGREAHQAARARAGGNPDRLRVELVDLDISKAGLVDLLNGAPRCTLLRTWAITRRGGLVEVANGD